MGRWIWSTSVKQNDFLVHDFAADWAFCDLVSAQLTCPVPAQEYTVLAPVHAHLTLCLHNTTKSHTWIQKIGRRIRPGKSSGISHDTLRGFWEILKVQRYFDMLRVTLDSGGLFQLWTDKRSCPPRERSGRGRGQKGGSEGRRRRNTVPCPSSPVTGAVMWRVHPDYRRNPSGWNHFCLAFSWRLHESNSNGVFSQLVAAGLQRCCA